MIVIFLSIVRGILKEKETKAREGMRMMGMTDTSFYLSWILYYMFVSLVISLICSGMLKAGIFKNSNYLVILITHWLYGISLIFQGIFVTAFFTNSKLGVVFGIILFVLFYGLEQVFKIISLNAT
jgi:ATP-binding cassette, subfamily A (ABC1), member 3